VKLINSRSQPYAALFVVFLASVQCESRTLDPIVITPPPQSGAQPNACRVKDMSRLREIGPALVDWAHTGEQLLLTNIADANGNIQVHVLRPDGMDVRCLTCRAVPGGPPVGVHKGNAHWHPSGKYIFLQVERPEHGGNRLMSHPGAGQWNNIWATTPTGDKWWKLTDYDKNPAAGVLFPVPSPDGRKLAWAERYAGPSRPGVAMLGLAGGRVVRDLLGHWRLNVADIVMDDSGVRLRNVRQLRPGATSRSSEARDEDVTFYEMQVWSPDSRRVYFAADIRQPQPFLLDIWSMDVETGAATQLVSRGENWEEHLAVSPDGRKIAYMSSECCKWDPNKLTSLLAEMYLMDRDGSNRVQLTRFNEQGKDRSVIAGMSWAPDGRRLAFARILMGTTAAETKRELWMMTFEGACGRT
jgi:hypothetical protein